MTKLGCPFCNPFEQPVKINKTAQLLFSDPRKVPGHFLVTPIKHIEKPWDLNEEQIKDIFDLIFFVEQKIVGNLGDGCDIRQNYRPYVEQNELKIDHIHFHIIPRSDKDYIDQNVERHEKDNYAELDDLERESVLKLLELK